MLKQQLQQKLQQKLSPQQIQVIRLLELTAIELEERIKQELIDNPALDEGAEEHENPDTDEFGNEDTDASAESAEDISMGDYLTEDDIPDYKLEADNFSKDQKHEDIPFSGGSTFHDFLLKQLGERNLSEQDAKIAEYIIGNIDDNGYLQRPLSAISDDLIFQVGIDISTERLEDLLQMIQDFEPVSSRSVQICAKMFLIADSERHEGTPAALLAYKIIDKSFDEFTKKHYDKIQKQYNVSEEN